MPFLPKLSKPGHLLGGPKQIGPKIFFFFLLTPEQISNPDSVILYSFILIPQSPISKRYLKEKSLLVLPGHCSNWIRRVVCRKRRWQFFCLLQNIVGHLRMRALLCSLCRQPASRLSWQYQPIRSGDCPSTEQEDVKSLTLGHAGTWRMHERLQPSWGRDSGPSTHSLSSCVCVCVFV